MTNRSLFQQHHFNTSRILPRLQAGEVDAGGETGRIPGDDMSACLPVAVKDRCHPLAEEVVDGDCDRSRLGQHIA